jgi:hypothetical protein
VAAEGLPRGHDWHVTERPSQPADGPLPDPVAYDSPRAERARAKGLKGPYITGGEDPGLPAAQAEERRLGRLLLAMVLLIVSAGFVIGIVVALVAPGAGG